MGMLTITSLPKINYQGKAKPYLTDLPAYLFITNSLICAITYRFKNLMMNGYHSDFTKVLNLKTSFIFNVISMGIKCHLLLL
jgi:hypothetical protein